MTEKYMKRLRIGCSFGTLVGGTYGTIGAFVDLPDWQIGCIVSADTLLSDDQLLKCKGTKIDVISENIMVYQPAPSIVPIEDKQPFGRVTSIVYITGEDCRPEALKRSTGVTGVAVALITITDRKRIPESGRFAKVPKDFREEDQLNYCDGNIFTNVPHNFRSSTVLKYGAATGLTKGAFSLQGRALIRGSLNITQHCELHNQIQVCSMDPIHPFAKHGDVGALVMMATDGDMNDLRALGILVGGSSNYTTFYVTPIWEVLKALELPLRLHDFSEQEPMIIEDELTIAVASIAIASTTENDEPSFGKKGDGSHYIGGNIAFFPLKELGHGSHSVVYEGSFGRFNPIPVAVKVIKCLTEHDAKETQKEITSIYREITTMETLNIQSKCTNIIGFINSFIETNRVYIAFELAKGTLHDYVDTTNVSWQNTLSSDTATRGVVDGLNFTHRRKIVHRDLKPANVYIVGSSETGLRAVIGDYGSAKATTTSMFTLTAKMGSMGYIAPEIWKLMSETQTVSFGTRCSKQSDIFSLALVIFFTLSLGKHPYGNEIIAQSEIEKASAPNFEKISFHMNSFAYVHMLQPMLNNDPTERPRIEEVSEHPALMSADKVMDFFVNKSDEFENQIEADPLKANILEDPSLVTNMNWMNQLPVHVQTYLRSYKLNNRSNPLYQGKETNIRYLLLAVRITKAHRTEYPIKAQKELGDFPDGHVAFWLKVCPKLLMHVYNKLGPL